MSKKAAVDEAILYFNQSSLIQLDIVSYTKKSTKTLPHPTVFPVWPFFAKSDFSTAMHMLKKALAIDEKVHGEDHPDTAMRYNNLGIVAQEIEDSNDSFRTHAREGSFDTRKATGNQPSRYCPIVQ